MAVSRTDAREFLKDLKYVTGTLISSNCHLGGGLDGAVELYQLEENGLKRNVAVKTSRYPENHNESVENGKEAQENWQV